MKPAIIHIGPETERNHATITFKKDLAGNSLLDQITFKKPIRSISYEDFFKFTKDLELLQESTNTTESESKELTIGGSGLEVSSNKVKGLRGLADRMFNAVSKDMSEEEKKTIGSFFNMFDKEFKK